MGTRIATLVVLLGASALAGCGSDSPAAPAATTTATTAELGGSPADREACARIFSRLQRVTLALETSSELIAHSVNKAELSRRIAVERVQLERSARLMSSGLVPARLTTANRNLIAALRALARDFERAEKPAARGDFQAAVDALTDRPIVRRIVAASKTIEGACRE